MLVFPMKAHVVVSNDDSHCATIVDSPRRKNRSFFASLAPFLCQGFATRQCIVRGIGVGDLECALRMWPTLLLPSRPLAQPICFSTADNRLRIYLPTSLKTLKSPHLEGNQTG